MNERAASTPQLPLTGYPEQTFSHHIKKLWAFDRDKVDACLVGHCFGQQSFAAARRPTEKDAGGCFHPQSLSHLGVVDRTQDAEFELFPQVSQGADVLPGHVRDRGKPFAFGRRL